MKTKNQKGFTLVELLVVLFFCLLISAVIFAAFHFIIKWW